MNAGSADILPASALALIQSFADRTGLRLRPLGPDDLDILFRLHRAVIDALPSPELFAGDSRDYFARHLGDEGFSFGAFADASLVGYSTLRFPRDQRDNLGLDLKLPPIELPRVAHLESVGVLPGFRGKGLNAALNELCVETAVSRSFWQIAATVAPANLASVRAKARAGMMGKALVTKSNGRSRIVFHRDVRAPTPPVRPGEYVSGRDKPAIAHAFARGLWVVGGSSEDGRPVLHFGRRDGAA